MVLISSKNWAQNAIPSSQNETLSNTSETVYIHLNANSFITGETIFYKLYSLNPQNLTESHISQVAYVELINSDKKTIFSHKLFLENAKGQGDYFIPSSVPTGTYKLVGYTRWMLNKSNHKSFESDITIINPFQNDSENKISSKLEINSKLEIDNNEKYLKLNKKVFSNREEVNLKINNLNKGNYSLSIRKAQDLPSIKNLNTVEFSKTETNQAINFSNSNLILPELRGEIISGTIVSKNNLPLNNISVGLSIPGKSFDFKLVKTNSNGQFIFNLNQIYSEPNIIIQIINNNKEDYSISLDKQTDLDFSNTTIENDSKLSYSLKSVIEEHSIASQIENTYFEKKADTLAKASSHTFFYEPIAKEYILDNYTRFPTIKETITEVVKEMHYYKNDKAYSLYLSDYDPITEIEEPPLVLIDGLMVQDINELLDFNAANIYKICVINQGYSFGNKIFNGLISFITKKIDYSTSLAGSFILKTNILIPFAKKKYYTPNYSNSSLERIPDYRYQLLWMPELSKEKEISFYTSDKKGTFEIDLEGFTIDGIPVSTKEYFEVK